MNNKLKEDETKVTSLAGKTFEEAAELLGSNLFDEENIPLLKDAGLLDNEGYPIEEYESWNGDMRTRPMSVSDILEYDSNYIESKYIKELAVKEILKRSNRNENGDIIFNYHSSDLPENNRRDMSKDFLEACFAGDVLDYFLGTWNDINLHECSYHFDDIPEEVIETLEYYGLPRNFYELLDKGEMEDDGSPIAEYYDDLENIMIQAVSDSYERGSEIACLNDFEAAWKDAIPEGCRWDNTTTTEDVRPIIVPVSFIEEHIDSILKDWLGYYSNDVLDAFHEFIKDTIAENFEFREPYYGWQEFDEESFKDDLYERLIELDLPNPQTVEIGGEEEHSLLNFNGETGEYEEDLEEEFETVDVDKPKKLFYKYKEYNKELSAKAWRLDIVRVNMLIDWLKDHKNYPTPDGGTFYHDMLEELESWIEYEDFSNYIILSKVKPSYAREGIANYYCVWIDNGDYDVNYLGAIPQSIGEHILKLTPVVEELDVINVPYVEIGPDNFIAGHEYAQLEDIVARKANSRNWMMQIYDAEYDEWENEYTFKTLAEVLELYNWWDSADEDDAIVIVYVADPDEDPELEDGSYVICGKFGSGKIKMDEEDSSEHEVPEDELHYYYVWWCPEDDPEDGDLFRTGLIVRQNHDGAPSAGVVMDMYSEGGKYEINSGFFICDVDEVTKEEFEDYFMSVKDFDIFDLEKYDTIDLSEEIDNTVTYYEVYCEPEDETTWNFEIGEFDGEPCYDNQSVIIAVDDSIPEPTPEQVKEFFAEEGILSGNYIPLYLSELDPDYAPSDIFDDDMIHYYKPKDSTIVIEDLELVDFPVDLPKDNEAITLTPQQKEDLVYMFPRYLDYLKSIPEYWDDDMYKWILVGEDNRDGHIVYGTKVFAYILKIMYVGPTDERHKVDQRIWMELEFKDYY